MQDITLSDHNMIAIATPTHHPSFTYNAALSRRTLMRARYGADETNYLQLHDSLFVLIRLKPNRPSHTAVLGLQLKESLEAKRI